MTELQKQFQEEKGISFEGIPINGVHLEYITWLESQIQALRIHDVVGRSEQLSCGRNITTCVFYKDGGKCSNTEYCRDQTT